MASILIIDDEVAIAAAFAMFFRHDGQHVVHEAYTGGDGVDAYWRLRPDLVLLDVRLPDMTGFDVLAKIREDNPVVIMITAYGDVPMAVDALHKGAENFLTKPVDLSHLSAAADRALEKSRLRRMNRYLSDKRDAAPRVVFGASSVMRDLSDQVMLLAQSDRTTGLVIGERGSGKGRVAELIHQLSPRASKPFVDVNCAALTAESLDIELFGEEGSAGRPAKLGLFEIADGGTLFLDEIGDLSLQLQPKLLRALEGKGFRRHGGTVDIVPNTRVIAATSRDLGEELAAGRFREDLYYRLSVMPIRLIPLRERTREDMLELLGNIMGELAVVLPGAPDSADGRGARGAAALRVAGQHSRTPQRTRTGDAHGARGGPHRGAPPRARDHQRQRRRRGAPPAQDAGRRREGAHRPHAEGAPVQPDARRQGTRHRARDADQEDQGIRARRAHACARVRRNSR